MRRVPEPERSASRAYFLTQPFDLVSFASTSRDLAKAGGRAPSEKPIPTTIKPVKM